MKVRPQLVYFILPVVLTAVFIVAYGRHQRAAALEEARLAAGMRVREEQAQREQEELEKRLEEEARLVAEAKAKALREKEEAEARERAQRFADLNSRLQATLADLSRLQQTVAELRGQIEVEKAARKQAEDAGFAMGVEVEKLRARKASLDIEVQRLTGAIMDRFETSWRYLTELPPQKK